MVSILARTRWGNKGKKSQTVCELSVKNSWKHTVGWNLLEELQIEKKAEFLSSYPRELRDQQTLLTVLQISSSASCSRFLWKVWACILLLYPHCQDFLKKIICETLCADSMWIDLCTTCLKASKNEFSDSVMNEMKWKLLSDLLKTKEGSHSRAWTRLQKSYILSGGSLFTLACSAQWGPCTGLVKEVEMFRDIYVGITVSKL